MSLLLLGCESEPEQLRQPVGAALPLSKQKDRIRPALALQLLLSLKSI